MIDGIIPDQYSAIGKLHQIAFVFDNLKRTATEAVDIFSGYDKDGHVPFLAAVQESLDAIRIIEEALEDAKTILKWMRCRQSEIFNQEQNG